MRVKRVAAEVWPQDSELTLVRVSCSVNKSLLSLSHNGAEHDTHIHNHSPPALTSIHVGLTVKPYQRSTPVFYPDVLAERSMSDKALLSVFKKIHRHVK